jgi:hypothetical protein
MATLMSVPSNHPWPGPCQQQPSKHAQPSSTPPAELQALSSPSRRHRTSVSVSSSSAPSTMTEQPPPPLKPLVPKPGATSDLRILRTTVHLLGNGSSVIDRHFLLLLPRAISSLASPSCVGRLGPRGARHGATRDFDGGRPRHQGRALPHQRCRPKRDRRLIRRHAAPSAGDAKPLPKMTIPHSARIVGM